MNEPKQPKFYNLVGHGGEVVPDMLCCEGCGYGVCSCPDELPDDAPYGCVNRQISSPRDCVESGHYYCDAFKSEPQPAEPTLRAGWTVHGIHNHAPDYWFSSVNAFHIVNVFRADYGDDAHWRVIAAGHYNEPNLPTLEAAVQRAEALARGEP